MANKSSKQTILAIPIVGPSLRILSNIVKLPSFRQTQEDTVNALKEQTKALANANSELKQQLDHFQVMQESIQQQFSIFESFKQKASTPNTPSSKEDLFADDHIMDKFYTDFEDRFRGTEAMITERLKEYLPLFASSKVDFKKSPVLDIGSGRGELLELLEKNKISAIGLDINIDMVERSKKKGLRAEQGDALSFLQKSAARSYGSITGFHIVEHIPFNVLMRIFTNAHRALVPGGFVIFETPNPENIIVGSSTFYTDPSHLHPLPPRLLAFALEECGFTKVEIKRLHPDTDKKTSHLPKEVAEGFFGPRDYAVIGYK